MVRPSRRFTIGVPIVGLLCLILTPKCAPAETSKEPDTPAEAFGLGGAERLIGRPLQYIGKISTIS